MQIHTVGREKRMSQNVGNQSMEKEERSSYGSMQASHSIEVLKRERVAMAEMLMRN